jgi:hypothetical protein
MAAMIPHKRKQIKNKSFGNQEKAGALGGWGSP